jgi:hypothetical protein
MEVRNAFADFKANALLHSYSLGKAGKTATGKIGFVAYFLNAFATVGSTLIVAPIIFALAKRAARRQESASVDKIIDIATNRIWNNRSALSTLFQEKNALTPAQQTRLNELLKNKGVVI